MMNAKAHTHPLDLRRSRLGTVDLAAVVGFALLTAIGATIAFPLPGTPVPITLQTLFVVLSGMVLGPALGTASMVLYLLLGVAGFHVFAAAEWNSITLFGATGGYLVGFILCQPIVGRLGARAPQARAWWALAAMSGEVVILLCGLIWLGAWLGTDLSRTLELGLWPFVPGAVVKAALAVGLAPLGARLIRRLKGWF